MIELKYGAEEGTRTPTGFLPQPPQGCVSTNFTTPARAIIISKGFCFIKQKIKALPKLQLRKPTTKDCSYCATTIPDPTQTCFQGRTNWLKKGCL
jgi:hypothetical protein